MYVYYSRRISLGKYERSQMTRLRVKHTVNVMNGHASVHSQTRMSKHHNRVNEKCDCLTQTPTGAR